MAQNSTIIIRKVGQNPMTKKSKKWATFLQIKSVNVDQNHTNIIAKSGSKSHFNLKVGQNPTAIISEMWFKIKQI